MRARRQSGIGVALAMAGGLLLLAARTVQAQLTTNDWLSAGDGQWTNTANWASDVPDADTDVARFIADYAANFNATQDVNLTVNGIDFEDTGGGTDATLSIRPVGGVVLTFGGTNPFVNSRSTTGGGAGINFYGTVDVGTAGLIKTGGGTINLQGTLSGSGPITLASGAIEVRANNAATFTGEFIVNGGSLELRGGNANAFGSTDKGITLNGGRLRLRDLGTGVVVPEPVTVNGWYNTGAINNTASLGVNLAGAVTLNTNGWFSITPWNSPIEPGRKMDFIVSGVIADDGNDRNNHFMLDAGSSNNATGTLSRTSEFILSASNTYGGFTHITANRVADGPGEFTGTVRLTNGNDRLPVTTTVILGGITNGVGLAGCNGRLVLGGYNQELAGLVTSGSGTSNQVVGGAAALSTLTMNLAAGRTNLYAGALGGAGPDENNLALVVKGGGLLVLSGATTYSGPTTVTNGALQVSDGLAGGGLITVQNGGTLGGTGLVGPIDVEEGGALAPGASAGLLTADGAVSLALGSVFSVELNGTSAGAQYDQLAMGGNPLTIGSADLAISLGFTPAPGDAFAIVTGLTGFDPVLDGTFKDRADGSTFLVGATEFQIDYHSGDITVTVVPEPGTLGLLGISCAAALLRRRFRGA